MEEQELRQLAAQLRKPQGEIGIKTGEWMNRGNVQINLNAIRALNLQPADRILEIGMGNGYFVQEIMLSAADLHYTGCDFSDVMVQTAAQINEPLVRTGRAAFVEGNAESLPFADGTFDKIFTVNTIYFWENPRTVLAEIKRVMRPGALFVTALRPGGQMRRYPFTQYGFNLYEKETIVQLFENNGFRVLHTAENPEPDFELSDGTMLKMENLIMTAGAIQ